MIGGGNIDVQEIDGDLYINMWQLTTHILQSAYAVRDIDMEGASIVASTLGEIAATLSELAIYTLEKEEIDNVDDMIRQWSGE